MHQLKNATLSSPPFHTWNPNPNFSHHVHPPRQTPPITIREHTRSEQQPRHRRRRRHHHSRICTRIFFHAPSPFGLATTMGSHCTSPPLAADLHPSVFTSDQVAGEISKNVVNHGSFITITHLHHHQRATPLITLSLTRSN